MRPASAHHFDEAHRSDPATALQGAPPDAVRILLAHQPRSAVSAALHVGPAAASIPVVYLWVYTSRGTGYWSPPKRFGAPSEITLLRLVLG